MRFNELMTGARQDVVCKIFGENLDTLKVYSEKLAAVVNKVNGAQNIYVEPVSGLSQIVINYNRSALAQYGLNVSDVNNVVNAAFAGKVTGAVFEGEKNSIWLYEWTVKNAKSLKTYKTYYSRLHRNRHSVKKCGRRRY